MCVILVVVGRWARMIEREREKERESEHETSDKSVIADEYCAEWVEMPLLQLDSFNWFGAAICLMTKSKWILYAIPIL